jgi:hypothetical protein
MRYQLGAIFAFISLTLALAVTGYGSDGDRIAAVECYAEVRGQSDVTSCHAMETKVPYVISCVCASMETSAVEFIVPSVHIPEGYRPDRLEYAMASRVIPGWIVKFILFVLAVVGYYALVLYCINRMRRNGGSPIP